MSFLSLSTFLVSSDQPLCYRYNEVLGAFSSSPKVLFCKINTSNSLIFVISNGFIVYRQVLL